MGLPVFPELPPAPSQSWIIDYLLETVALEELALAALLNAEADKVQAVVGAGIMGPVAPETLEAVNESVSSVIGEAAKKEELLARKLSIVLSHKERTAAATP